MYVQFTNYQYKKLIIKYTVIRNLIIDRMDYITNIIEIIKPPGIIDVIDDQIVIEYNDIKLTYLIKKEKIEIISTDYLSYHILRLVSNKLITENETWINESLIIPNHLISEYFIILKEILETNYYNYCTICGLIHDRIGLSFITTCNNSECVNKSYHYPIDNKITEFYKSDSSTLILLFKTLFSAFNHPHVDKILVPPKIFSNISISALKSLIPKNLFENKFDELMTFIADSYDDFYLWKKINNNLVYALLINAISNNYYSIYSYRDLVNFDLKKKIILKDNVGDEINIEYYNINYSTEIENKIKSKLDNKLKYYYLYHGSPFHCWNSIIKNGLKVMSGTAFMTTGAAYGKGIYLSNQLSVSNSYAKYSPPFNYSMIGLFQITEDPESFKKSTGIYVVPDEKLLILRTLIKINKCSTNPNFYNQLDDYFIRQRTIDKSISEQNLVSLKNKRLSAELKLIEKVSEKFKVIKFSDDHEIPWLIQVYAKAEVYTVEMQFHNYPLTPPFFQLIDFKNSVKGIIDKDYKINLPMLNPSSWNISNKIVEVLEIIWTFFTNSY